MTYQSAEDCPQIENHTSHPTDYLSHVQWADRMLKTHRQTKCPECGFWCIWIPKDRP